jgi:hypothetical protein
MELWNRSLVAVVTVLGALLCGVVVLSALLVRFPTSAPEHDPLAQGNFLPAMREIPEETRNVIALRTLELVTSRARIAQLEANEREYRNQIRTLQSQLREIREQFQQTDLERDASLEWLNVLLASSDFGGSPGNSTDLESTGMPATLAEDDEATRELETFERQLELDELREQVASLQRLVEDLQTAADLEMAELLIKKRQLGHTTAELFARLGEEGVPILVDGLESPDPLVRQWAANSLRLLGPEGQAAIPYLLLALDDGDERVREAAQLALSAIRD